MREWSPPLLLTSPIIYASIIHLSCAYLSIYLPIYVSVSVGDGAGVGKGRTVAGTQFKQSPKYVLHACQTSLHSAGIIYQNYLEGRKKALW